MLAKREDNSQQRGLQLYSPFLYIKEQNKGDLIEETVLLFSQQKIDEEGKWPLDGFIYKAALVTNID